MTVHDDWYPDGVEDGKMLWRLDFPDYQAQLFREEGSGSFSLFLERDVRAPEDPSIRIDYAGATWPLTADRARRLLTNGLAVCREDLREEFTEVAALPCDPKYCDLPKGD